MLIDRTIYPRILTFLQDPLNHGVMLYGPRQAGKTTLLQEIAKQLPQESTRWFTGDDLRVQELFSQPRVDLLKEAVGSATTVVIDEAQRIDAIGLSTKLLIDALHIRVILSGSSSLELSNKTSESLSGRVGLFFLFPFALNELKNDPLTSLTVQLDTVLRFGMYPLAVIKTGEEEKGHYLMDLVNTYLYKDILSFGDVRKPKKVIDLLSLLALQIGSEVSIAELSTRLSLSRPIVEKYLDLLEKMFIVVNVRGLSRNLRKEIYKTSKYYFYDIGLRNALIRNVNPLHLRADIGALFENFCIIERMKILQNAGIAANFYFWRTYDQKEIDLVEDRGGKLTAWEFKWSEKQHMPRKTRDAFLASYPESVALTITPSVMKQLIDQR